MEDSIPRKSHSGKCADDQFPRLVHATQQRTEGGVRSVSSNRVLAACRCTFSARAMIGPLPTAADGKGEREGRSAARELCGQPAPEECIGLRRPGSNGRDGL
jgi:hypothetical protein